MWDWQYALSILPVLLQALKITISAAFAAFGVACIGGLALALARRSSIKLVSTVTIAFVEFIRNTPLLPQLYFIFYVFPKIGIILSPFIAGVVGLGIHYSTYLSEVYRAGIDNIPQSQWDAAIALNFSKGRIWSSIIIPQAMPPIIPIMGNYLISMFKDTTILSAIALVELLEVAKMLGSETFRYLEPITLVGIIFLILSYTSSLGIQWLEVHLNRK